MPACSLVSLLTHPPPILISLSGCLGVTSRHKKKKRRARSPITGPTAQLLLLHYWTLDTTGSPDSRLVSPLYHSESLCLFCLRSLFNPHSHSSPPEKLFKVTSANGGDEKIRGSQNPAVSNRGCCSAPLLRRRSDCLCGGEPGSNLWWGFCAGAPPCVPASLLRCYTLEREAKQVQSMPVNNSKDS